MEEEKAAAENTAENGEETEIISPRDVPSYFHADVSGYSVALKHAMIIVIIPLLAVCVFCAVNIVLHFKTDFAMLLAIIIAGCVLFGMIFAFCAVYLTYKYKRRHARFTFFDILPQGMVFSEYAGEYAHYGVKVVLRRLYYIPFESFESVSRDPKRSPRELNIKGEIRYYFYESDRLGYHIDEDGVFSFDTAILNISLFETLSEVTVKKRFGNTKALMRSILYYKERFDNAPEKRPFDISEFVAVRRKRRSKTSNPALEAPSFNRKW